MTDGILLAEIQSDHYLNEYDVLIIDEAHERSLNIDFILGYLKNLLSKRKDLKIIISSATIDTESFSNMEYIVDNSNRRNVYLNESELTTIELDSITNKLFSNRVIYNNSASKLYRIYDNTGYPTGTYQEPNKGSYSGNTNDLTENEIDNLVAGNDYDGGGSNTPWTVLEKIWILVNLDISSSNPTTRYYWSVTY